MPWPNSLEHYCTLFTIVIKEVNNCLDTGAKVKMFVTTFRLRLCCERNRVSFIFMCCWFSDVRAFRGCNGKTYLWHYMFARISLVGLLLTKMFVETFIQAINLGVKVTHNSTDSGFILKLDLYQSEVSSAVTARSKCITKPMHCVGVG